MKNRKLLTYHLKDLHVPLVVRVPQVGNPCITGYGPMLNTAFLKVAPS